MCNFTMFLLSSVPETKFEVVDPGPYRPIDVHACRGESFWKYCARLFLGDTSLDRPVVCLPGRHDDSFLTFSPRGGEDFIVNLDAVLTILGVLHARFTGN